MDKLNVMYDHYKDSFMLQRENERTRNKLFIYLVISILVLMLMIVYPNNLYTNIQELIFYKLGINLTFELSIIELFIWFFILYLTIRYYQINANIEKNYKYIHKLEDNLQDKHKLEIYREGKNYLEYYPLFLTFSYIFYKYVFPVLFVLCVITKIAFNIINKLNIFVIIISCIAGICLIILNVSYFAFNLKLRNGGKKNGKTKSMRKLRLRK